MEDSALYMLQPLKYVLDEDYIFVHGSLQEGTLYRPTFRLTGRKA
ncbi:hypothetical protein VQ056_21660 [Paenibacillus sp. JTLBN-2024]